jgi:DNA-binding MarR family transcriptional regulator
MAQLTGPMIAECSTWLSIVSKLFGTRMQILLEPHGLTPAQFSILHHVARQRLEGGTRISDIAAAVEVEQPAVTKTMAKFQNMELVDIVSSKTDRRAKLVSAKPAAGELLGKVYQDIGPDLYKVFDTIGAEDIVQFTQLLQQLGQWLDQNRLNVKQ